MTTTVTPSAIISWTFGILAFAIGIVNTFWGNDPFYGLFILLLSFVFFPPVTDLTKKWTGQAIPGWIKILLAAFILWSSLGVGELFDKIDLMLTSLNS
jgi:cobalamin biosynthesis protein CobD/CbiB